MSHPRLRLKGAPGHIYRLILDNGGECTISVDALSSLSGYCPATIKRAIHHLHQNHLIEISKKPGDRRNCYACCQEVP